MAEYSWLIDDIETLSTYTKDGYTKAVLNQAVKEIRKLSANVAQVRHGRWILKSTHEDDPEQYWECSICGCGSDSFDTVYHTPYCPNCGAKMDGEA